MMDWRFFLYLEKYLKGIEGSRWARGASFSRFLRMSALENSRHTCPSWGRIYFFSRKIFVTRSPETYADLYD